SRRRGQRDHEERHERVSRRRILLSAQQQVGRAQSARCSSGTHQRRVHSSRLQAERCATPVWWHHRWSNRKRQSVLLLQLRSAKTKLPRPGGFWSERFSEPELN